MPPVSGVSVEPGHLVRYERDCRQLTTGLSVPRFDNPIEYPFAAEAAAALGHAGRKLRKTLDSLLKYDREVGSHEARDTQARQRLVAEAAEAFWSYVVQREQFGLLDPEYIAAEYGVPEEVQRAMGPNVPTEPGT